MGFFSFLRRQLFNEPLAPVTDPKEYMPSFWEDDYCQIEIVPKENKEFIEQQIGEIEDFSKKSKSGLGFTDIFQRGKMPTPTISEELRVDYLESMLTTFRFPRAKHIRFDSRKILNCETGNTKAFGFSNFTI